MHIRVHGANLQDVSISPAVKRAQERFFIFGRIQRRSSPPLVPEYAAEIRMP
jgi:hypothetical protein